MFTEARGRSRTVVYLSLRSWWFFFSKIEEKKLEIETATIKKVTNGRALFLKEIIEENKKQIGKNQKHYLKAKQHFFGLIFSEKNISISVIESVKEFLIEGCYHNHCVFTNEYYKKQNSLILSAKIDGIPTETIQLSLENFEILQSRGRGNKASKHNKQILSVMKRNCKLTSVWWRKKLTIIEIFRRQIIDKSDNQQWSWNPSRIQIWYDAASTRFSPKFKTRCRRQHNSVTLLQNKICLKWKKIWDKSFEIQNLNAAS